jgi:signal transduction histidine kinase
MTTDSNQLFEQQYQAALLRHLNGRSRKRPSSRPARLLGGSAFEAGVNVQGLVRMHDKVLSAIAARIQVNRPAVPGQPSSGAVFLLEALMTLEEQILQTHQSACEELEAGESQLAKKSARFSKQLAESRRQQKQSQQLAHQILLAQEEERREISRELHDEVAQILAGINVRLAALRETGSISHKNLEKSIAQTQQMIEASVIVVHRYARKLRPAMLDDLGLIPALRSFIKELPHTKDLTIRLETTPEVETMDNMRRTVFYRVAQEALLNVVRHAEARTATISLVAIPKGIRLEIQDDGKAFEMADMVATVDYQRLGLLGMKERVQMVGGKFYVESKPGKGTNVRAVIPYLTNLRDEQA